jgi:hypothetical protein
VYKKMKESEGWTIGRGRGQGRGAEVRNDDVVVLGVEVLQETNRAPAGSENDKSLLGRVRLELLLRVTIIVDNVACVTDESTEGEVCNSPCPSQGSSNLARSRLGGFVSVGPSEGNATSVVQSHGDRRPSRGLGNSREGASCDATAGCHVADPGEGRHGSRGGSHCEGGGGRKELNWERLGMKEEKK